MKKKCYIIPVQKACNLNCRFCSTKFYNYSSNHEFLQINEDFYKNIQTLKGLGINYFEITGGGEPFLNTRLQDMIDILRNEFSGAYIKLYTNGRIHKAVKGIDELDISVVHWDSDIINDICRYKDETPMPRHLEYFREQGDYIIRISVPMFKEGIATREDALELIKRTNLYADKYVFRPMNEFTPDREEIASDFSLDMDNVEVDTDFCCCNRILLWFSDNVFYSRWNLEEKFIF
jgi:MoaA/NifB/PqqE/SkfB family radical SAM enzyme